MWPVEAVKRLLGRADLTFPPWKYPELKINRKENPERGAGGRKQVAILPSSAVFCVSSFYWGFRPSHGGNKDRSSCNDTPAGPNHPLIAISGLRGQTKASRTLSDLWRICRNSEQLQNDVGNNFNTPGFKQFQKPYNESVVAVIYLKEFIPTHLLHKSVIKTIYLQTCLEKDRMKMRI